MVGVPAMCLYWLVPITYAGIKQLVANISQANMENETIHLLRRGNKTDFFANKPCLFNIKALRIDCIV